MSSEEKQTTGTYSLVIEGKKYLGIATGLTSTIVKTVNQSDFLSVPGIRWSKRKLKEWPLVNTVVRKGEIIPYGEWYGGNTLADRKLSVNQLYNTALFFQKLHAEKKTPGKILSTGLYYTDDNDIILFPEYILDLIASHQDELYTVQFVDAYNHPELQGEKALCFTLGVIAYKMVTGKLPFYEKDSTTLRESIRRKEPLPPSYKVPGIRKDFSQMILSSLKPALGNGVTLSSWIEMLEDIQQNGYTEKIDRTEAEKRRKEGDLLQKKNEKAFKRKLYFLKNWKLITGIIAGVLFAGFVLSAPLKKIFSPPVTKGMPAKQVVRLYYTSINKLDIETLSDCVTGRAGKQDIKEVTGIFVISRVRTGYEGKSGFLQAAVWLKKGKPVLKPGVSIYGITGLKISRLSENTYRADYVKWTTEVPQDTTDTMVTGKPEKACITDTLHLVKKRGAWIIDKIQRSIRND